MENTRMLSIPTLKELTEVRFKDTTAMLGYLCACGFVEEDFEETSWGNIKFAGDCAYSEFFPTPLGVMDSGSWCFNQQTLETIDRVIING